jgi:hypothetical protein
VEVEGHTVNPKLYLIALRPSKFEKVQSFVPLNTLSWTDMVKSILKDHGAAIVVHMLAL